MSKEEQERRIGALRMLIVGLTVEGKTSEADLEFLREKLKKMIDDSKK
jgi:hypothetical protein